MIYSVFSIFLLYLVHISSSHSIKPSWVVNHCSLSPGYDLCGYNVPNENGLSPMSPFRMIIREENFRDDYFCACDSECHYYNDCCVNVNHSKVDIFHKSKMNMSCVEIIGSTVPVFAIDSCPASFSGTETEEKCRSNPFNVTYLYEHFPVYSVNSKVLYNNLHCAICNDDTENMKSFPISVACNNQLNSKDTSVSELWFYNKELDIWKYGNTSIECDIKQKAILNEILKGDINVRPCRRSIDTCDAMWNDPNDEVAQMCRNYTSYVTGNDSSDIYKNIYCSACNFNNETFCAVEEFYEGRQFTFKTLLNIDFAECKLSSGLMYDRDLKSCVHYDTRGEGFRKLYRTGIQSNSTSLNSEERKICRKVIFPINSFTQVNESTVYINVTKTFYSKTKFYLNTDGSLSVCVEEFNAVPKLSDKIQTILSYICLISSIICLILHLIVYSLIPKLRTKPGKILMSLTFSLLVAHISFLSMSLIDANQKNIACIIDALLSHYFFLCSFFWMNVMSFDIYSVLGALEGKQRESNFLKYSLYAWLCPAVIVLLAMGNEYLFDYNDYQPMYGVHNCWFGQRNALLVFFVVPLTVIMTTNTVLFVMTIRQLIATKKITKNISKKEETIRFRLYVKVAIVMGLTWIFGVAASLSGLTIFWYPFIVLNASQGVFLFFTFAFKRNNFDSLKAILKREKSMATTQTHASDKS